MSALHHAQDALDGRCRRIWLDPFFAGRDVRTITTEDVRDLMRVGVIWAR
jgi:ribosomal protein L19E